MGAVRVDSRRQSGSLRRLRLIPDRAKRWSRCHRKKPFFLFREASRSASPSRGAARQGPPHGPLIGVRRVARLSGRAAARFFDAQKTGDLVVPELSPRFERSRVGWLSRVDVDDDVADIGAFVAECFAHLLGDGVAFADWNAAIDDDVQIDAQL